jgi:tetratricopeptide (TPR) repeat protein
MRALFAGLVWFAAALALVPPIPRSAERFPAPPPLPVVRAAALGRTHAASDLLWLRTIQLVGERIAEGSRYPRVDEWVDAITTLDPAFDYPYAFAAVLLSTEEEARLARVDRILARGERAQPDTFWFPFQRGFLAYFGLLDTQAAIAHYQRASTKKDAPPNIGAFARKLEETTDSCARMPEYLTMLMRSQSQRDARALRDKAVSIVEHCVQSEWRQAAVPRRLAGESDTLESMVASGAMKPLPQIPGLCWGQDERSLPKLKPCAGETR